MTVRAVHAISIHLQISEPLRRQKPHSFSSSSPFMQAHPFRATQTPSSSPIRPSSLRDTEISITMKDTMNPMKQARKKRKKRKNAPHSLFPYSQQ